MIKLINFIKGTPNEILLGKCNQLFEAATKHLLVRQKAIFIKIKKEIYFQNKQELILDLI